MKGESWLCPTELDRSRITDASDEVRKIRLVGSTAVGLALVVAAPWIGWWTLILFALSVLNFVNVDRRLRTSPHPERVSAGAIVITMAIIGTGVALSGGTHSPALGWMVLPMAMTAARFRRTVVIASFVLTVAITLVVTLGAHLAATLADPAPLVATLAMMVGVMSIVFGLQTAELHHRDEAILDPLTGLLNRHALVRRFIEITQLARITDQPVCLVLCDIDNFKLVNDRYGHQAGDAVLRDLAYDLRQRLRSFELVYRLGGEEFLLVLPGSDSEGGLEAGERLRAAVEQLEPEGISITMSVGVSAARGEDVDYDSLFRAADTALYDAKNSGRNRVSVAPPVTHATHRHAHTPWPAIENTEAPSSASPSALA